MKTTAAEREAMNEGRQQNVKPYPVVWVCQHCANQEPCPLCNVCHQEDNIKDGEEIYLEDDWECGLTFAYHLTCREAADASWEHYGYLERGGRMQ